MNIALVNDCNEIASAFISYHCVFY